jgi:hypothetical protein
VLAYEHLNLRFNPFGELHPRERARVAVIPPLCMDEGEVLQVLGAAGRGKTTHLVAWHHATPSSAYEYVPEGSDRIRTKPLPAFFFLDEAQRLNRRQLARLFANVPRLVVATHDDLSRFSRRPVRSLELRGIEPWKLARIVSLRIEAARRNPGPLPTLSDASLSKLLLQFGDDLRAMEGYLYDRFQNLEAPCDVEL